SRSDEYAERGAMSMQSAEQMSMQSAEQMRAEAMTQQSKEN
ncbi:MAG: hypothetical protein QOK35_3649, partial [Pseudonocardiales bacterium]|nr:hypothetical protein [Pseudonocardiales bacterium]